MDVILKQHERFVMKAKEENIREKIEQIVEDRLGLFLELESSLDEGRFQVYMHSGCYDYLTEEQISTLANFRITDEPETTTEGFKKLLGLTFKVA